MSTMEPQQLASCRPWGGSSAKLVTSQGVRLCSDIKQLQNLIWAPIGIAALSRLLNFAQCQRQDDLALSPQ